MHYQDPYAFFEWVRQIGFVNPFGDARRKLDRELRSRYGSAKDPLTWAVAQTQAQLRNAPAPENDVQYELEEHAHVFVAFFSYYTDIDAFVQCELREDPATPSFAKVIWDQLHTAGMKPERIKHALELVYQMRRAYFFIDRWLVGNAACMLAVREAVWNSIFSYDIARYERFLWQRMEDFSTILLGETGTGKGQAAAAIGRSAHIPFNPARQLYAHSFKDAFVPINLSEFPETLIESELFGHKKGAFTGANESQEGLLARCPENGSVFLDEIGDVSVSTQVKLLRVIQERKFRPLGSRETKRFHGRIIAATHRDLSERIVEGSFREDFYHRLATHSIWMPSLRQRLDEDDAELPLLVGTVLRRIFGEARPELKEQVSDAINAAIPKGYPWPGNVRELEQRVRQVLLSGNVALAAASPSGAIEHADLGAQLRETDLDAQSLLSLYCAKQYERHGSYADVARISGLDRRTVKKHVLAASS